LCFCASLWLYLVYDANVVLDARVDFEVAGKLAAEPRDLDGLALAQAAHVYACRSADEGMNFTGAVIDEDDESEWQIIHDRLTDYPGDRTATPHNPLDSPELCA
jgi:hypothetical protein